uniref:Uncharacterized protein n=1 Tax=Arundo donax TaxID=35708 RepID=A0A0A8YGL1_ARUDO
MRRRLPLDQSKVSSGPKN